MVSTLHSVACCQAWRSMSVTPAVAHSGAAPVSGCADGLLAHSHPLRCNTFSMKLMTAAASQPAQRTTRCCCCRSTAINPQWPPAAPAHSPCYVPPSALAWRLLCSAHTPAQLAHLAESGRPPSTMWPCQECWVSGCAHFLQDSPVPSMQVEVLHHGRALVRCENHFVDKPSEFYHC